MEDFMDCNTCQHYDCAEDEFPCNKCKLGTMPTDPNYGRTPVRWEGKGSSVEKVNHPSHYNQGNYECIDVMIETFGKEATMDFCLLNAFKYIWRTGEKNGIEDIKKAIWYLSKYVELDGGRG